MRVYRSSGDRFGSKSDAFFVYAVDNQGKLYRKALEAAMADARLSAETLAVAAGRSLGKVTSVVESGGATPVPMFEKAAVSDSGTPIEAGTQQTTASVTVTFALG